MQHAVYIEDATASKGDDRAGSREFGTHAIVALADGAGGTSGGRLASTWLVDAALRDLATSPSVEQLAALLEKLDAEISRDPMAGETTAVVISIEGSLLRGASVGDSQAWLLGDDATVLTGRQSRKPLLGSGRVRVAPFEHEIGSSTLIVASDGLFNYASESTILGSLDPWDGATTRLADAVRLRSGALPDDLSVILVRR